MDFMIVGADFLNKGAQAMLFVTVDELKKRFPQSDVKVATYTNFDQGQYNFSRINYTLGTKLTGLGGVWIIPGVLMHFAEDLLKLILKKKKPSGHYFDILKHISDMQCVIDISGFGIGDSWSVLGNYSYILNIALARKYGIPIILMPQSFGPFSSHWLQNAVARWFKYPGLIFAREKQGVTSLQALGIDNVIYSSDIVLSNAGIEPSNIYRHYHDSVAVVPSCKGPKVGIVPNGKCFIKGNPEAIYKLYVEMINKLIKDGYTVIILRHSDEDRVISQNIYDAVSKSDSVLLEDRDLTCLEYEEYVKEFDFIICSRFHGLVHAFRRGVPSIALAWAIKYTELFEYFDMRDFVYDITREQINEVGILSAIDAMEETRDKWNAIINEKMGRLRSNHDENCFDVVEEFLKNFDKR